MSFVLLIPIQKNQKELRKLQYQLYDTVLVKKDVSNILR